MSKNLVLTNSLGDVVRVFPWENPEKFWAVFRHDNKRLEILTSLVSLKKKKISFDIIKEVQAGDLNSKEVTLNQMGQLSLVDADRISPKVSDQAPPKKQLSRTVSVLALLAYIFTGYLLTDVLAPEQEIVEEVKEEKKREIVKVVRRKLKIPKRSSRRTLSLNQPNA